MENVALLFVSLIFSYHHTAGTAYIDCVSVLFFVLHIVELVYARQKMKH